MGTQSATSLEQGWAARNPQVVGALILVALHLLFIASLSVVPGEWTGVKSGAAPMLIGFVQAYYVIPATLLALKLRRPAVAMGIVKAALVTFALNLAGCGLLLMQLSKIV